MEILLIFFGLLLFLLSSVVLMTFVNGISPMPSSLKAQRRMREILPLLSLNNHKSVYELGAGWGNLAVMLAKYYPNKEIHAYENSLFPFIVCWVYAKCSCQSNLKVHYRNFFNEKLDSAALVVCYLYPGAMKKLSLKLQELPESTWIISNTFALPNWKPFQLFSINDFYNSRMYVYLHDLSYTERDSKSVY